MTPCSCDNWLAWRNNKYCVLVGRIISTLYLAIPNLSFDNHLPEDGTCRSKHVPGVPCIYKLLSWYFCTNFAVLRAPILLMLFSGRPQCALFVHRTTTHNILCSAKHALSMCSVCVFMRPVFCLQYQVLPMKCFAGRLWCVLSCTWSWPTVSYKINCPREILLPKETSTSPENFYCSRVLLLQ